MASKPPDPPLRECSVRCSESDRVTRCITHEHARLLGLQTQLIRLLNLFPTGEVRWLLSVLERELGRDVGRLRVDMISIVVSFVLAARVADVEVTEAIAQEREAEAQHGNRLLRLCALLVGRPVAGGT